jgi:hypothetical protein
MATIKTQKITGDLGSQEVAQLITSYNALLDVLGDLITGLKTVADEAATHTLATTAETALEANVYKVVEERSRPLGKAPAKS